MKIPNKGILYLLPVTLGESEPASVLPSENLDIIRNLDYFIVERVRTARRFLKSVGYSKSLDDEHFFELDKHLGEEQCLQYLGPVHGGHSMGLMSEAGMPCLADPGSVIVAHAHRSGITVKPLPGPSSILLALAASGFNAQQFSFHGYLPVNTNELQKKIRELERLASDITQIFMETPYRNNRLLDLLMRQCRPDTRLCIAADITLADEMIKTKPIAEWQDQLPDLRNKPAVFLLSAG